MKPSTQAQAAPQRVNRIVGWGGFILLSAIAALIFAMGEFSGTTKRGAYVRMEGTVAFGMGLFFVANALLMLGMAVPREHRMNVFYPAIALEFSAIFLMLKNVLFGG